MRPGTRVGTKPALLCRGHGCMCVCLCVCVCVCVFFFFFGGGGGGLGGVGGWGECKAPRCLRSVTRLDPDFNS